MLKPGSPKGTPILKIYKTYTQFEPKNFDRILKNKLKNFTNHFYVEFEKVFLKELNKHAPLKKKNCRRKLCCNQNSKMNLIKKETVSIDENRSLSNLRKTKKECFNTLNFEQVSNNNFSRKVSNYFLMKKDLILQNNVSEIK